MSIDEQNDVLRRFSEGLHKCLVTTSVAYEGIDIPKCNMAIRYKLDANVITSLQMRGKYIIFIKNQICISKHSPIVLYRYCVSLDLHFNRPCYRNYRYLYKHDEDFTVVYSR